MSAEMSSLIYNFVCKRVYLKRNVIRSLEHNYPLDWFPTISTGIMSQVLFAERNRHKK